jgi:alpha-glucosidase
LGLTRWGSAWRCPTFLLLCVAVAAAQDERIVRSPDGQIEFRLSFAQPQPGDLFHLAYQVSFHGKPLLDTSFFGLEVHNQEPILGANLGLTSSHTSETDLYHSLVAEYVQNGSLGRRLNLEVRVYNSGVAFRYLIPKSTPLEEFLLEDEATEFSFSREPVIHSADLSLPAICEQPGVGFVAITEMPTKGYPPMHLVRTNAKTLITRLARLPAQPDLAIDATTPITSPWRVLLIGASSEHLLNSKLVDSLGSD